MARRVRRKQPKNFIGRGDKTLFGIIVGLTLFGAIMVFSSSVPLASLNNEEPYYYFLRQIIFIAIGAIGFIFTYNFNYRNYIKLAVPGLIVTAVLLVAVLFLPEINETHRWIKLGTFTFQVSDLAKLTLIIYLASWLSKPLPKEFQNVKLSQEVIVRFFVYQMLPFILILGGFSALIILEPDLSTTMLIGIISVALYFLASNNFLNTLGTLSIFGALGLAGIFAGITSPYRFERLATYTDFLTKGLAGLSEPFGRDFQLRQILIAVGTGGVTGEGFAQSKQKFSYLTEPAISDAIFAVFAEELGLIGGVVLVGIFMWIMFLGFKIAANATDKFGALLASGITLWITLQAFMHLAVNVGLMPLTGLNLPFISYGGTSIILLLTASGILLNISRYIDIYD